MDRLLRGLLEGLAVVVAAPVILFLAVGGMLLTDVWRYFDDTDWEDR